MSQDTIYSVFKDRVLKAPNALAVFDERRSLSAKELAALTESIAAKIPYGAKRIGIVMEHGVQMIGAILAVLKRGCSYIPVEPFFPEERIEFMMKDAGADAVLVDARHSQKVDKFNLIEINDDVAMLRANDECEAAPDDVAYVLYTSGSTNLPKGIAVTNKNVCAYARAFKSEFNINEADTMLQHSVCSFDIFVEEVFASLLNGAALAIPSNQTKSDIGALMKFVRKNNVTIISGFPYLLLEINGLAKIPKCLRLLISGGDVLRAKYVDKLLNKIDVYNTYGPSETTVCASYYRCNDAPALKDGTFPIGKAILGTRIEILNKKMQPVKEGETGEICISGEGVSAGYVGDRKAENRAFIRRADGSVIYRSGDLGYVLPDGNLAFLRRKDTQVMIFGKRVETTEVENVLCRCSQIKKAVVKAYVDEKNLSYLVAYVVFKEPHTTLSTLKKEMERFLPGYMIPEFFIAMNDIKVNQNGKIDAKALPVVLKEGNLDAREE